MGVPRPSARMARFLVLALACVACRAASAADLQPSAAAVLSGVLGQGREIVPTSFIVRFEEPVVAEASALATMTSLDAPPADVRAAATTMRAAAAAAAERIGAEAAAAGISLIKTNAFGHVMTGMTVKAATPEDAAKLRELLAADPSVAEVHPVVRSRMDRVAPRDPEDSSAPEVTGSSAAQPEIIGGSDESTLVQLAQSKYLGQGIKVGVIDDGLDYTHPAFGSCTAIGKGENCRVVAGHDFTDGDDVTYDVCGPHGTHVAGIIGGDMMTAAAKRKGVRNSGGMFVEWRGIAPKAQLGIYRVFACDGTIQTDWLLGALDRAVADGMDIINLSMGTSWASPLGVLFSTRLAKQGVMVAAAAGNDGSSGLWTYGNPGGEPDTIAIGSTDNKYSLGAEIAIDAAIDVRGKASKSIDATTRAYMGSPLFKLPATLVRAEPLDACDEITNKAEVAGKVVLVQTGICGESTKASNLLDAGAASILFFDHNPGAFKNTLSLGSSLSDKPPQMFATNWETGKALAAALKRGPIKITGVQSKQFLSPNADGPSWFSSWGPDINMRLLPSFSAPGGGIWSSIPNKNYAAFQGTSMATPYAAGALALWRQAKTVAGALRNGRAILQSAKTDFITTAKPVKYDNEFAQSVVRVGAGLIQVESAIDNDVEVKPDTLLLPTDSTSNSVRVTLTNTGSEVRRYSLGHKPAMAVNTANAWYEQEKQERLAASVSFRDFADTKDITRVSLKPGQTVGIRVNVEVPAAMTDEARFYSGYVTLTPISEGEKRGTGKPSEVDGEEEAADAMALLEEPGRRLLADVAELEAAAEPEATKADAGYPALSLPYLGMSQPYNKLAVVANPRKDVPASQSLASNAAMMCNLMTSECNKDANAEVKVSPTSVSIGFIGFALSLMRPVESMYIEIYDAATNKLVGTTGMATGPIGWQGPLRLTVLPVHATASYWQGEYVPVGSASAKKTTSTIKPGSYKFAVVVQKPTAVADKRVAVAADYQERIKVMGTLVIDKDAE